MFLGTAITPCLPIITARTEKAGEYVEVTTQIYGIYGFSPQVVSLTKQQYERLGLYLVNLRMQLNSTTDEQKTVLLLREAIGELDTYGLLPNAMVPRQLEQLMCWSYQSPLLYFQGKTNRFMEWTQTDYRNLRPDITNLFCLLFAVATKISNYTTNPVIIPFGVLLILCLAPSFFATILGLQTLSDQLAELGLSIWLLNPFRWSNLVLFNGYEIEVRSVGLLGLVGKTIPKRGVFSAFTGLMLTPIEGKTYFLGGALSVSDFK